MLFFVNSFAYLFLFYVAFVDILTTFSLNIMIFYYILTASSACDII